MFEQLFRDPRVIARHQNAPYAGERARYLAHCANQGYSTGTLLLKARELIWAARKLRAYSGLHVTIEQLEEAAQGWDERERHCGHKLNTHWTRIRFLETARPWLRFLGSFKEPAEYTPFENHLALYVRWMERDRCLVAATIERRANHIRQFLHWYGSLSPETRFEDVSAEDLDAFLAQGGAWGWCRKSIKNMAQSLRGFFQFAATKGWCNAGLPEIIRGPRIFSLDNLPMGPAWSEVQRLLAHVDTDYPADIRDRAILMMFSIYGVRSGEVAHLRLENLDWERDLIHISRVKGARIQTFPLVPSVGNAIIRYLREVRPPSMQREVFLTLLPPFRPLSRGSLYSLTRKHLTAIGVKTVHRGPHALRHACAARLAAQGLGLKEIGDHLGHRSTSATRIYAKVDLASLRHMADFDLGELT